MQTGNEMQALLGRMIESVSKPVPGSAAQGVRQEHMPFRIKVVKDELDLAKAVSIRHSAYARHVPAFAATLATPEASDFQPGNVVLLAESKLDGSPIGTMRITNNSHGPLGLEQSVKLPDWLEFTSIAEATRLGVATGRMGTVVKTMLFKAFFQFCLKTGVEWMVIAARSPMDRQYEDLLFEDVFPDAGFMPMRHAGGIPHRVLALDVLRAHSKWSEARHPLLGFMCDTLHPDIDLSGVGELLQREITLPSARPAVMVM